MHNPLARDCHRLIRDGVRLVEGPSEIIETLAPAARMLGSELAARLSAKADQPYDSADGYQWQYRAPRVRSAWRENPEYRRLWAVLGDESTTLDELVLRTGNSAALSGMLLMLEMEVRVESLPGNRYQRLPD
jgi:DNA processing protein